MFGFKIGFLIYNNTKINRAENERAIYSISNRIYLIWTEYAFFVCFCEIAIK